MPLAVHNSNGKHAPPTIAQGCLICVKTLHALPSAQLYNVVGMSFCGLTCPSTVGQGLLCTACNKHTPQICKQKNLVTRATHCAIQLHMQLLARHMASQQPWQGTSTAAHNPTHCHWPIIQFSHSYCHTQPVIALLSRITGQRAALNLANGYHADSLLPDQHTGPAAAPPFATKALVHANPADMRHCRTNPTATDAIVSPLTTPCPLHATIHSRHAHGHTAHDLLLSCTQHCPSARLTAHNAWLVVTELNVLHLCCNSNFHHN